MKIVKLVAELGINHNGDVELAKDLIKMSKDTGFHMVKFQKRHIPSCYSEEELNKPRESQWGNDTRAQKYGIEFEKPEYNIIDDYCKELDIPWFASPWDETSVDFICGYDIPYIKIASAHVTHLELLRHIKSKNKPVILSIGMSIKSEVDKALDTLGDCCQVIMHATSSYPTPTKDLNILKIRTLKYEYGDHYQIGYSNHSTSVMAIMFAASIGATWIETHITKSRALTGSDQAASIERRGMEMIADWTRDLPVAMGTGDWGVMDSEIPVMKKLRKRSE